MRTDLYQGHDYYLLDELLTEEHKLIRETAREWVKRRSAPSSKRRLRNVSFPDTCYQGSVKSVLSAPTSQRNTAALALTKSAMASSCKNSSVATVVCVQPPRFKAAW